MNATDFKWQFLDIRQKCSRFKRCQYSAEIKPQAKTKTCRNYGRAKKATEEMKKLQCSTNVRWNL